jgi:hypothetical protein
MLSFACALPSGSLARCANTLDLRHCTRLLQCPHGGENDDYGVAHEIFVLNFYSPPEGGALGQPRLVVDLGGNVGLSVLHWLNLFPGCQVETFEPNPLHVARRRLSNLGTSSSLLNATADGFEVPVADLLAQLEGRRIDLLKLDIEGGEYEILEDERFGRLDIGCVVMEWHSRGGGDADRLFCEQRLAAMGFSIHPLFAEPSHGMFWAVRASATGPASQPRPQRGNPIQREIA